MRVDRPIGTLLLLWPTLWALWLAGHGAPPATIVIIFIIGTCVMRAAGCVVNDLADRKIDRHVQRTADRPLASGELDGRQAVFTFAILLAVAIILVMQLNALTIRISLFALAIAIIYPFTKRFTHLPQLFLGIAFSMGIPMAYAAVSNHLPAESWLLFAANYFWIVAYDTQYAMADREEDLAAGIRSTAILFGRHDLAIVFFLMACVIALLAALGIQRAFSWHYFLGLACAGGLMAHQYDLCHERDSKRCLQAFLNNSWVGAVIYFGIVLSLIEKS